MRGNAGEFGKGFNYGGPGTLGKQGDISITCQCPDSLNPGLDAILPIASEVFLSPWHMDSKVSAAKLRILSMIAYMHR